jgi:predicted TIM-barrel fold metal-dependent hydrolase
VRRVNGEIIERAEFYRPALDALVKLFGAGRLMYGSNWPVSNRVASYATLHKIVADYFSGAAAEKYFWKNSRSAYRWVPRGAAKGLRK